MSLRESLARMDDARKAAAGAGTSSLRGSPCKQGKCFKRPSAAPGSVKGSVKVSKKPSAKTSAKPKAQKPKGVAKAAVKGPSQAANLKFKKLKQHIPLKQLNLYPGGCARCRNASWCTPSCWRLRGFSVP